jgi:phosphoglucomutase
LVELWQKFGYYHDAQESVYLEGREGMARIKEIMEDFRHNPPVRVCGTDIVTIQDYKELKAYYPGKDRIDPINMSVPSDVLRYRLEDGSWFAIRPSGTEPKIKLYFSIVRKSLEEAENDMQRFVTEVMARIR